jgi:hypothetical protein
MLESRFSQIRLLLEEALPMVSQDDQKVIKNFDDRLQRNFYTKLQKMSAEEFYQFDGLRKSYLLEDNVWMNLIDKMSRLIKFPRRDFYPEDRVERRAYGKKKKQYELNACHELFHGLKPLKVYDFGGGVGNLSHYLNTHFGVSSSVIDANENLIIKGRSKLKTNKGISFIHTVVDEKCDLNLDSNSLGVGLHTCGNFAFDMLKVCSHKKIKHIVNFGCCYSKITNHKYHLSQNSQKKPFLNYRALASATLSFGTVERDQYDFRLKILDYKYSFYHWLYTEHGILKFCPMSNARRSLYSLDFKDFVSITLKRFFPHLKPPAEKSLMSFYKSHPNRQLIKYFTAYYACSRYFGELVEAYLLVDRALYLQQKGYESHIFEVFDPQISPRNKAIVATLNLV